jgi:hypothetical protein
MAKIFFGNFSLIGFGNKNPEFISSNFVFVAHLENASIKTIIWIFITNNGFDGSIFESDKLPYANKTSINIYRNPAA